MEKDSEVGVDRYFLKLGRNPGNRSHCLESFIAFNSFSQALDDYRYSRQSWCSRVPSQLVCELTRGPLPMSPKRTKIHSSARRNPRAWRTEVAARRQQRVHVRIGASGAGAGPSACFVLPEGRSPAISARSVGFSLNPQ